MLAVAGVVVDNGLVIVHFVNQRVRSHGSLKDAVCEAGAARFRPILLTSLTTTAGVTPLILEKSPRRRSPFQWRWPSRRASCSQRSSLSSSCLRSTSISKTFGPWSASGAAGRPPALRSILFPVPEGASSSGPGVSLARQQAMRI